MSKIFNFKRNERNTVEDVEKKILTFSFFERLVMNTGSTIIGPIIPIVAVELAIGLDYVGSVISIGAIALLVTSICTGFLLELFGFKKIILIGELLYIVGCLGLIFSNLYITFAVSYTILKLGSGTISVATMSLVGNHKDKSRSIMISNIGFTAGSVIAPLLVSLMFYTEARWQVLFFIVIIPQILLIFSLIFLKMPSRSNTTESFKSMINVNKSVISHPYIILCCIVSFLYNSTTQTFYTWFTSYFSTMNIELGLSSLILAAYAASLLVGMFIKNHLVKYIEEKDLLLVSIFLSFVFLLLAFFVSNIIAKIILIFLFGINISGNFSLTFSMGLNVGTQFANVVSGLVHAASNLGVIVFQFLIGYLSESISKNSVLYIDLTLLFFLTIIIAFMNKREFKYLGKDTNTV